MPVSGRRASMRVPDDAGSRHRMRRWGHSSVGRALEWHSRGRRFDSAWLHQSEHAIESMANRKQGRAITGHRTPAGRWVDGVDIAGGCNDESNKSSFASQIADRRGRCQYRGRARGREAVLSSRIRSGVSRRRLRPDDRGDAQGRGLSAAAGARRRQSPRGRHLDAGQDRPVSRIHPPPERREAADLGRGRTCAVLGRGAGSDRAAASRRGSSGASAPASRRSACIRSRC